jgi:hypothetical protein
VERVKGIEPSSVAWEATALPLSYTRVVPDKSMRRDGKKATGGTGPPVVRAFPPPRAAPRSGALREEDQKLPLKLANSVASRARFCSVVVLMPTLLFRPHRLTRAPSTAVA